MRHHGLAILGGILILAAAPALARTDAATQWHITGDLSEACSCSVPCSCNFGENPSPHGFCYALFGLDIQSGSYNGVKLDGLRLAGANGAKGMVWYIDERANSEQAVALTSIAATVWHKALDANGIKDPKKAPAEFRLLGYKRARIEQSVGEKRNYLKLVGAGAFASDYVMGLDGKTPVVVENNWSWNIQHGMKGKTRTLAYHDAFGNRWNFQQTNANQGKFDWSESTPIYFR